MVQPAQQLSGNQEPLLLAIDTSTEHAGLALGVRDRVTVRSWPAGRTQTTSILPAIDAMLVEAGLTPAALTAIAVATGPGTFTGLRVGMSIAKGIVLARGIPLVGIPTLELAAASATDAKDRIAILPAGRGRVVWQRFVAGEEHRPRNTTLDEFIEALSGTDGALVIGELGEDQQVAVSAVHPHTRWEHRDPAVMIRMAGARLERGERDDPVTLEPMYLHGVVVQSGPVEDRLKRKG
jgi:tRNA threonylcarbamoyladenosine biosynthesis protein TsaB